MQHSGQTKAKIEHDTDRDFILTASQGLEYGIIDQVISKRE
jgi:ATP-dependent Clp protease protease subunit